MTDPSQIYLDETVRKMVTTTRSYILGTATAMINEAVMAERADSIATDDEARKQLEAYKTDRYAKAKELLTIIEEKLPEAAAPTLSRYRRRWHRSMPASASPPATREASAKAIELLEKEIMRYAGNVKYYQSLNPWQYATLPKTDRFIETYYMVYLLQDLGDIGGDPEKMVDRLTDMGVNFDRIVSILQQ